MWGKSEKSPENQTPMKTELLFIATVTYNLYTILFFILFLKIEDCGRRNKKEIIN